MYLIKQEYFIIDSMRNFAIPFIATLSLCHGYDRIDSEPVRVHFVPHSHMDAGWLKTYDEYYT